MSHVRKILLFVSICLGFCNISCVTQGSRFPNGYASLPVGPPSPTTPNLASGNATWRFNSEEQEFVSGDIASLSTLQSAIEGDGVAATYLREVLNCGDRPCGEADFIVGLNTLMKRYDELASNNDLVIEAEGPDSTTYSIEYIASTQYWTPDKPLFLRQQARTLLEDALYPGLRLTASPLVWCHYLELRALKDRANRMLVARPGDAILQTVLTDISRQSDVNTGKPPTTIINRIPLRYEAIGAQPPITSRLFVAGVLAGHRQVISEDIAFHAGCGEVPDQGGCVAQLIQEHPSGVWNALLDPGFGGIQFALADSSGTGQPEVHVCLASALAGSGIFQIDAEGWKSLRSMISMPSGLPKRVGGLYHNALGSLLFNQPNARDRRDVEYEEGWDSESELIRNSVRFGTSELPESAWSLAEWEASGIYGKFTSFPRAVSIDISIETSKKPLGVEVGIIWPGSHELPSAYWGGSERNESGISPFFSSSDDVRLVRFDGKPCGKRETVSHQDFLKLATLKDDDTLRSTFIGFTTDDGYNVSLVDDPYAPFPVSWNDELGFYMEKSARETKSSLRTSNRKDFLYALSCAVVAAHAWDFYRLPLPCISKKIEAVRLYDGTCYTIVDEASEATHVLSLGAPPRSDSGELGELYGVESGEVSLVPRANVKLPPHAVGSIFRDVLKHLNSSQVAEIIGLDASPIYAEAERRQHASK